MNKLVLLSDPIGRDRPGAVIRKFHLIKGVEMLWKMVTENETRDLGPAEQLFAYADAYLSGATIQRESIVKGTLPNTWPSGSMVLMLAAHATELILKGAIIHREPTSNVLSSTAQHDLIELGRRFWEVYPEPVFAWTIPFQLEALEVPPGFEFPKPPAPSILYRYPNSKGKSPWPGCYGFVARTFLEDLKLLREDFSRIRPLILSLALR